MYSGTTLTNSSGELLGAHQKIDRVARRQLAELLGDGVRFPPIKLILHFEGEDGPDGIKRKSPDVDEPRHFINPFDKNDRHLIGLIEQGYDNLVQALKVEDEVKAAFEAAWLSHALVDGLTPAHHFPYEKMLAELRGDDAKAKRDTISARIFMPGASVHERLEANWKMWGPKGLMITHTGFEWGAATVAKATSLESHLPTKRDIKKIRQVGPASYFLTNARAVAQLKMYKQFYARGWTLNLARQTKHELLPRMVRTVTLVWYLAAREAAGKS